MKKRVHVLPCGAVHQFKEFRYEDMVKSIFPYILENVPVEVRRAVSNPDNVGRKLMPWTTQFYRKCMNIIWKKIVQNMLDGNRVVIKQNNRTLFLYIGKIPDIKGRIARQRTANRSYFNTNGQRYGVILEGLEHSYYFRMTFRNRKRLFENIMSGKNYH